MSEKRHKFNVGDKVVYVNDFGVCWGVKTITELCDGLSEKDGPRYQYEGTDTPWFPVAERNLTLADAGDLIAAEIENLQFLQEKHGFTPTIEQLGGCY